MSDAALDTWRLLGRPDALAAAGLFVVEGREAIARLLHTEHEVVSLLLAPAARLALQSAIEEWSRERSTNGRLDEPALATPVLEVTPAQMREVTGFNFHRGALALARRPAQRTVDEILEQTVGRAARAPAGQADRQRHEEEAGGRPNAEGRSVFVILEHLVDVDNVGSCFRNARAFGAAAVLLDDRCADPLYRKAVRTSMGTVLELPWTVAPVDVIVTALHTRGVATVALTPSGDAPALATAVQAIDADTSLALVVGNEGHGLAAETLVRCSHRARIPMAPGADSLNVATALAVGLYHASRLKPETCDLRPET